MLASRKSLVTDGKKQKHPPDLKDPKGHNYKKETGKEKPKTLKPHVAKRSHPW